MKKIFVISILIYFGMIKTQAQESVNTSGANAIGSGGSVSYSVGQVAYSYENGLNGNSNQGVQQPYEIYSVSIENTTSNISLTVFPNPTTDVLNLQFEDYIDFNPVLILINPNGKILINQEITSKTTSVNLSEMAPAVYILNIVSASKTIETFKIIKK